MLIEYFACRLVGEVLPMNLAGTLGTFGSFLRVKPNAQQAYAQ
jgi:hypothetical protein